ncbi:hypothetical protein JNB88_07700 [Rhizobium cauense]|uniref:hypothetical protein n=1 Tax=Rhizobium cauense TaxID=1166683 RepID=UPI001C6F4BFF|nr:hypothetical protein [Rhizobium cauense]MBW9113524.1 hypothetical protein [Rhizobium cauense]
MTRYTLLASGLPAESILNVNIFAETDDDARQQALATGMRLHLAGYSNFDLRRWGRARCDPLPLLPDRHGGTDR